MNTKIQNQAEVQELTAQIETIETGTKSNVQVSNNDEESVGNPDDSYLTQEKEFFKGLLDKQPTKELKVMVIDILREIWDFYDDTIYFAVYGTSDERAEFLQWCFMDPVHDATDEIAQEIGYESTRDHVWRRIWHTLGSISNSTTDTEGDDSPPF